MIGARRRPCSRPSRRRCFLASSRVEPLTPRDLVVASRPRGSRTRTTVFGGSSGPGVAVALAGPRRRRRRRRRLELDSPPPLVVRRPSAASSSLVVGVGLGVAVGGRRPGRRSPRRRPRRRLGVARRRRRRRSRRSPSPRPRRPRPPRRRRWRGPSPVAVAASPSAPSPEPVESPAVVASAVVAAAGRSAVGRRPSAAAARLPCAARLRVGCGGSARRAWKRHAAAAGAAARRRGRVGRRRPRGSAAAGRSSAAAAFFGRGLLGGASWPARPRPRSSAAGSAGVARPASAAAFLAGASVAAVLARLLGRRAASAGGACGGRRLRGARRGARRAGGGAAGCGVGGRSAVSVPRCRWSVGGSSSSIGVLPSAPRAPVDTRPGTADAVVSSRARPRGRKSSSLQPRRSRSAARHGARLPTVSCSAPSLVRPDRLRSGANGSDDCTSCVVERPLRQPRHRGVRTAARGQPPRAVRSGRRRVVRRVWRAVRPVAVSHSRAGDSPDRRRSGRAERSTTSVRTAARASNVRRPFLVIRSHRTRSARPGTRSTAARPASSRDAGQLDLPAASLDPVGQRCPAPASTTSRTSSPAGSASSSAARTAAGSHARGHRDLEVLGLAGHAGRRRADVGDLRVRA